MRVFRRRPMLGMAVVSLVATAVGIAISLSIDWFPTQASTAAEDIDRLWNVLLIASVPIFVLVMSVAIYSVLLFRVKPGDLSDGAPIHGNTRLEIVWVTIPFLMVSALAGYGWVVLDDIEAKQADDMVVNVTAQQFAWRFDYPDEGKVKSNELVLAKGRPVEFHVHTEDVIHSFWVPEFRLKTDAVPGQTTRIRVTPNRLGEYEVVCAELCGLGHTTMRQNVRVVSRQEFDDWVASEQEEEGGGGGTAAAGDEAGKEIFTGDGGCASCHTLADAGSDSSVGPPLDELTPDAQKFGKQEGQSPEEYVRTAIEDPNSFLVPGFNKDVMPGDFKERLSSAEIDTLVKYLLGVSGGGK